MQHKAQAIFEHVAKIFNGRKQRGDENPHYHDYLKPADSSRAFNIEPHYDTFNKNTIGYFEVELYDYDAQKDLMKFSINSEGGMVVRDGFDVEGVRFPQEEYVNLLIDRFFLDNLFQNPISVKEIDSIPPGSNPYRHDEWRQGSSISKFWEVMFTSRGEGNIENVRLIHTKTGRRFSLDLYEAEKPVVKELPSLEDNYEKLAG